MARAGGRERGGGEREAGFSLHWVKWLLAAKKDKIFGVYRIKKLDENFIMTQPKSSATPR